MNIIVPMVGCGTIGEGDVRKPSYLVDVGGKPLFIRSLDTSRSDDNFYFVIMREDFDRWDLRNVISRHVKKNSHVVLIDKTTGRADVISRTTGIATDDPLLIMSPDHISDYDVNKLHDACEKDDYCGIVVVAKEVATGDPRFYANVKLVNEKERKFQLNYITQKQGQDCLPVAGIYYWRHGFAFVKLCKKMMEQRKPINKEYHVPMVCNEAVLYDQIMGVTGVSTTWFIQRASHVKKFVDSQ